jgi:anti-sigma factor RsiW
VTADEARELFSAAYDGELDGDEQRAFDAALAADPALGKEYEELRALLNEAHALEQKDDLEVPDLLAGVQHKIRARSRGRFYRDRFAAESGPRSLLPILMGGVMLLVVAVVWLMLHYAEVEAPPERGDADSGATTTSASEAH